MWRLPATANAQGAGFQGIGALLRRPDVALTLALTLRYFTAMFALFAYIGPVLQALGPMSVSAAALPLTAGRPLLTTVTLVVWGVAGVGMMPPQQSRLAAAAPASAPLLLSLNTPMCYLGTALGSVVGGAAGAPLGCGHVAWAGLPFLALGWLTVFRRD